MIMDRQTVFSDAQQVTATAISTNVYDDANNAAISGNGELQFIANTNDAFAGGTSIKADLVAADDAALTTNVTTLVAGAVVALPGAGVVLARGRVPRTAQRYLGVKYTVVGTMTGNGNHVTAALVAQTDDAQFMPANTGLY
jgi:hypothetical protein